MKEVSSANRPISILVAEDSDLGFTLLATMIERICGVTPDRATNGKEACHLTEANRYDLIFMDQFMPEMCGIEATSWIRENSSEWPPEVIVGVSGSATSFDKAKFLRAGADAFLPKPLRYELLSSLLLGFAAKEKTASVVSR